MYLRVTNVFAAVNAANASVLKLNDLVLHVCVIVVTAVVNVVLIAFDVSVNGDVLVYIITVLAVSHAYTIAPDVIVFATVIKTTAKPAVTD